MGEVLDLGDFEGSELIQAPTDPIAEETSSATDILEERQKPSHKGYFKIVKEIMLTHTDEVI